MRKGQNPAKAINAVAQPQEVTVAIVTYIPFLSGYYAESLEVLKTCLGSIWENTRDDYDLMVFDNASCQEVQSYLVDVRNSGRIQYLILSEKNIGKAGAWNILFGGSPGKYIVYSDSDIYFYPGWLEAIIEALETFPNVGMVTGMPMWSPEEFSTSSIEWAQKNSEVQLKHGKILSWEDYWKHSRSLGVTEENARAHFDTCEEYKITIKDKSYYLGAGHFQFAARRKVLQEILPIPSKRPMGQVRLLDIALNEREYLRLSTNEWWVRHMGNTLPEDIPEENFTKMGSPKDSASTGENNHKYVSSRKLSIWNWRYIRKILQWLHGKTFDLLYRY
jgi:glycosyltransferase involved in cell wall biosynthesis